MLFTSISLGLVLLPVVLAKTIDITVGGEGKLLYSPEAVAADIGDQVIFHFLSKNHTATQSSFPSPCGRKEGGFDSGFKPVAANSTDEPPTFTVRVENKDPIWVYCRQGGQTPASHCGKGMVFAINCGLDNEPNSFSNFKKSAIEVGKKLEADAAATGVYTAPYGDVTLPPAPPIAVVTAPITLGTAIWTTTYSSYPGSPAATPAAAEGVVHKVVVGGPSGLVFDPPRVDALPRDTIQFEFHQKNHTVTQSTFDDPCRKMSVGGATGFDSGFIPVPDDASSFPIWNLTVNDTAPIWAYCRQQTPRSHCGAGMVFAVNSVEDSQRNFAAFQGVAKALNGTSASSESPAPSPAPGNGVLPLRTGGAAVGMVLAVIAVILV